MHFIQMITHAILAVDFHGSTFLVPDWFHVLNKTNAPIDVVTTEANTSCSKIAFLAFVAHLINQTAYVYTSKESRLRYIWLSEVPRSFARLEHFFSFLFRVLVTFGSIVAGKECSFFWAKI